MTDKEYLALDGESVRRYDNNGNLHVARSHLTKVQVRPYYGSEIPGWERLKLDPKKIYKGYCPAEELSKAETIESVNGIPIQLEHHPDYADAPQLDTRIGSTGTDGAFRFPYLDNSLHFTVEDAIKRILDGSMRELSLSYRYTPDFTPGKTPEGEDFDFVMRGITANHVALVEAGRAGRDVLVADSRKDSPMDEEKKTDLTAGACDGDPAVEKKEVALAQTIAKAATGIVDLHKTDEAGNVVDKGGEEETPAPAADEDKDAAIKRILAEMVKAGMKPEAAAGFAGKLKDLAYNADEGAEDEDPEPEDETDDDEGEADPMGKLISDGLKACGYDEEPEEFQKAFAEGVRYGEKKEKEEPEKLDREHESEGEKRALGEDSALKRIERRIASKFEAMEECEKSLGKVRFAAYDSAERVYLAALKQEGVKTAGISPAAARDVYRAFMAGKRVAKSRTLAQDSAPKAESLLTAKLNQIQKGV